jgi:hypothetical protein
MKKTAAGFRFLSFMLMASAFSAIAETNVYLNISDEELIRRINAITNLEQSVSNNSASITATTNTALSAGPADIGFVNQTISAGFTNANFTVTDLSAYAGTNVAMVTLQFKGIAAATVSLRTAGDTNTVDDTSINSVAIAAGSTANMTCLTDASGCVEVKATGNTSMTLIAFIRRHVFE